MFLVTSERYSIGGVMVCVLDSSAVDRGFEPRSGQSKDDKTGICCFSAKQASLRIKEKILWLEIGITCQSGATHCAYMSIRILLFQ
jgi:hypothetical protein